MADNIVENEQVNQEIVEESTIEKSKVKVKVLQTVTTGIGDLVAGTTRTLELDDHTLNNWLDNGLIEEVKTTRNKGKADESQ